MSDPIYCRSTGSYYPTDDAFVKTEPCEVCRVPIKDIGTYGYKNVCSFRCALALAEQELEALGPGC